MLFEQDRDPGGRQPMPPPMPDRLERREPNADHERESQDAQGIEKPADHVPCVRSEIVRKHKRFVTDAEEPVC